MKVKERPPELAKEDLGMVHPSSVTFHKHLRLPLAEVARMEHQRA